MVGRGQIGFRGTITADRLALPIDSVQDIAGIEPASWAMPVCSSTNAAPLPALGRESKPWDASLQWDGSRHHAERRELRDGPPFFLGYFVIVLRRRPARIATQAADATRQKPVGSGTGEITCRWPSPS